MPSLKINLSNPKHQAGCNCSFESWLSTQVVKLDEQKRLIEEWQALPIQRGEQGFLTLAAAVQWGLIRYAPPTTPPENVAFSYVGEPFSSQQRAEFLRALNRWATILAQHPYVVQITNGLSKDLANVEVIYKQKVFVGNHVVLSGPYSKSQAVLPGGNTADFSLCPCLSMAPDYQLGYVFEGQQALQSANIDQINAQEAPQVDYCGDQWIIHP